METMDRTEHHTPPRRRPPLSRHLFGALVLVVPFQVTAPDWRGVLQELPTRVWEQLRGGSAGADGRAAPAPTSAGPVASARGGIWLGPSELASRPTSGPAWESLKRAADSNLRGGELTKRDDHNVRVMAAALVAARLNSDPYRAKVRDALRDVVAAPIDRDDGLAANRRLGTYAIAADLIGLGSYDPAFDREFRGWLDRARRFRFRREGGGGSIIDYHERRPNNFGTHAGASRMAVALYLGDQRDFQRAVTVFRGWLGDRSAYAGFRYGAMDWQCDPRRPVGINPPGCVRGGLPLDGVLPDDQRRGGGFSTTPPRENYVYEALQGALTQAVLAHRQGHDAFQWSDQALLRAFEWLHVQAAFPAVGDDSWQPYIVNHFYGRSFPAPEPARPGKNIGWTDWTHR